MSVEENRTGHRKPILYSAVALSLLAASIHLWVMPEHFEEWWGYGIFFLVATIAQGAYTLREPTAQPCSAGLAGHSPSSASQATSRSSSYTS